MSRALRDARAQITADMGARAFDEAFMDFVCPSCREAVDDGSVIMVHTEPPQRLEDLDRVVVRLKSGARAPTCPACGVEATLERCWLHAFHPTANKDFVVRWEAQADKVERLWWDPEAGDRPASLEGAEVDALLRAETARALSVLADTRPEELAPELERALARWPGDPALMALLPALLELGAEGLTTAQFILDELAAKAPTDPVPLLFRAEILAHAVGAGLEGPDRLDEAQTILETAMGLPGGDVEQAHLIRGNIQRQRGESAGARQTYEALLERFPDSAQAHYNVGLLYLEQAGGSDPDVATGAGETALWHFERGHELDPEDPDYLVGKARALLVLGRTAEAREAVRLAREAGSEHKELKRIDRALQLQEMQDDSGQFTPAQVRGALRADAQVKARKEQKAAAKKKAPAKAKAAKKTPAPAKKKAKAPAKKAKAPAKKKTKAPAKKAKVPAKKTPAKKKAKRR